MILCDRCGKKLVYVKTDPDVHVKAVTVYTAAGFYAGRYVHMCTDCQRMLRDYIERAESYFMVNKDDPIRIFDSVKYWDENWGR